MILTLQVQVWRSLMLRRNFTMLRIMMMEQWHVLLSIEDLITQRVCIRCSTNNGN